MYVCTNIHVHVHVYYVYVLDICGNDKVRECARCLYDVRCYGQRVVSITTISTTTYDMTMYTCIFSMYMYMYIYGDSYVHVM